MRASPTSSTTRQHWSMPTFDCASGGQFREGRSGKREASNALCFATSAPPAMRTNRTSFTRCAATRGVDSSASTVLRASSFRRSGTFVGPFSASATRPWGAWSRRLAHSCPSALLRPASRLPMRPTAVSTSCTWAATINVSFAGFARCRRSATRQAERLSSSTGYSTAAAASTVRCGLRTWSRCGTPCSLSAPWATRRLRRESTTPSPEEASR
mmetsp:Transcript_71948/g.216286  ORF Transcript_71948/g.216286 Transcript_71948/m.216286 type:complete len:213 (+) Transcript_71948:82-720(+)